MFQTIPRSIRLVLTSLIAITIGSVAAAQSPSAGRLLVRSSTRRPATCWGEFRLAATRTKLLLRLTGRQPSWRAQVWAFQ
jgi:hypothetical protein